MFSLFEGGTLARAKSPLFDWKILNQNRQIAYFSLFSSKRSNKYLGAKIIEFDEKPIK